MKKKTLIHAHKIRYSLQNYVKLNFLSLIKYVVLNLISISTNIKFDLARLIYANVYQLRVLLIRINRSNKENIV